MPLSVLSEPYQRVRRLVAGEGVIPALDAVTPRRMTRILRDAQLLDTGHVTKVTLVQPRTTSKISSRIDLQFSCRVASDVPRRVHLKLITSETIDRCGRELALREVDFYTSVTRTLTPSLFGMGVVRCIDAEVADDGSAHLLLHDVSDTHAPPEWPIPPPGAQVCRAVDWAAAFHAAWWEHRDLAELRHPKSSLNWLVDVGERHLAAISDRLSARDVFRMKRIYASMNALWERGHLGPPPCKGYSLIHGDLHLWNILYPLAGADPLAVIDWELWNVGHPLTEAAYLIGLNWDRSRNPADERALVERYHRALVAAGPASYSWDDCWRDYRLGIIALFIVPAVFQDRRLPASLWWPHLSRLHMAYEQLGCDELLSELH